jgi:hypothetical protein
MTKAFFGIVGSILIIGAIVFGLNTVGFMSFQYWAPKYEGVRRDVMIQSRAYSEATVRELYRLKLQYAQAKTEEEKNTIKAFTLHEATSFDKARLPPDIVSFLRELETN